MKRSCVILAPDVEAQRVLLVAAAKMARAAGIDADERPDSPLTEWVRQTCVVQRGMLALVVCLVVIAMNEAADDERRAAEVCS